MNYQIKKLHLFQSLYFASSSTDKNETLTVYTSKVGKKDMAPQQDDYLSDPIFCGGSISAPRGNGKAGSESDISVIPEGTYAFVQGVYQDETTLLKAAEALWLECLWQEFQIPDNTVYMRKLHENHSVVFQLFRKITTASS